MIKLSKNLLAILSVITILLIDMLVFDMGPVFDQPHGSFHAWRQADCISQSYQIYSGEATIWAPKTHFVKHDGSRFAVGEFPLVNALVASVNRIAGYSIRHYRLIVYVFYMLFVFYLFKYSYAISSRGVESYLATVLISCSGILTYYSMNVLPDIPGLALCLAGLYYCKQESFNYIFLIGIILLTLAALIKITFLIWLLLWLFVFIYRIITNVQIQNSFAGVICCLVGTCIVLLWYLYANWMDHKHAPFIFLTETRSYWRTYFLERPLIIQTMYKVWLPQLYIGLVWLGLGLLLVIGLILNRGNKRFLYLFFFTGGFLWSLLFILFMFRQFNLHDYLWIGLIPVMIVGLTSFYSWMSRHIYSKISWIAILLFALINLQVFDTWQMINFRYFKFDNDLVYNQDLLNFQRYKQHASIKPGDWVISIPDPSPNITLLAMNQPGFTNYRDANTTMESILYHASKGAKYLIVSREDELRKEYLKPIYPFYLYHYQEISVFDVQRALTSFRNYNNSLTH